MVNWRRPLVSDVGEVLKIGDGNFGVRHADGEWWLHEEDGTVRGICEVKAKPYNLRNRPWRVGDPVVTYTGCAGHVCEIDDTECPIRVLLDNGSTFWIYADGVSRAYGDKHSIRYDYSRARTEPDIEALIADVLETHEAGVRDRELVYCVENSLRNWADSAFPDQDIGLAARSIIAMVREHDKREAV